MYLPRIGKENAREQRLDRKFAPSLEYGKTHRTRARARAPSRTIAAKTPATARTNDVEDVAAEEETPRRGRTTATRSDEEGARWRGGGGGGIS